jgi:hypothetical protein
MANKTNVTLKKKKKINHHYLASSVPRNKACTTSWNATASGILSTPPALPVEGMLTVNGDGPADLDPGRLSDVGEVDTPENEIILVET